MSTALRQPLATAVASPLAGVAPTGAARYRPTARREAPRWLSFAIIAALHVAALAALLQVDSVRQQIAESAPIFVSLITPPAPKPAEVKPPPASKPIERPRMIATPRPSPSPMQAPPMDEPVVAQPPQPSPAPTASVAVPAPAPVVSTPPRFTGAGLDNPQAEYPLMSRRLKESGRVVLRVLVDPAGRPDKIELDRSSGFTRLDESALAAVRQWHFIPARQGDQAVAQWVNVSIPFELTRS